jgi:hypothetical protein
MLGSRTTPTSGEIDHFECLNCDLIIAILGRRIIALHLGTNSRYCVVEVALVAVVSAKTEKE